MIKKMMNNKKGLTLIELLAVIVVLGIVAAIAIPSIGGVIERSKKNADAATLKLIEDAAIRYYTVEEPTASTDLVIATELIAKGYLANFNEELQSKPAVKFTTFTVTFASNKYTVTVEDGNGDAITETNIKDGSVGE